MGKEPKETSPRLWGRARKGVPEYPIQHEFQAIDTVSTPYPMIGLEIYSYFPAIKKNGYGIEHFGLNTNKQKYKVVQI